MVKATGHCQRRRRRRRKRRRFSWKCLSFRCHSDYFAYQVQVLGPSIHSRMGMTIDYTLTSLTLKLNIEFNYCLIASL